MSKEDLLEEINRGEGSRFQDENYAYLKTRLALMEQQEQLGEDGKGVRLVSITP
jgi:hypothetical protein